MSASRPSTLKHRVVVVEDSKAVRHSLELLLRTRGYFVSAFEDAEHLFNADHSPQADCFLIDFRLPAQDGLQVLTALRAAGSAAPAIMITSCLTADLRARALAAGFRSIVEKPPQRLCLIDEVANAIAEGPALA